MLVTKETDDAVVSYEDTKELRDKVFEAVMDYYFKYNAFTGETICQMDDPIIEAHVVFAEIADDIIKFDIVYKED